MTAETVDDLWTSDLPDAGIWVSLRSRAPSDGTYGRHLSRADAAIMAGSPDLLRCRLSRSKHRAGWPEIVRPSDARRQTPALTLCQPTPASAPEDDHLRLLARPGDAPHPAVSIRTD